MDYWLLALCFVGGLITGIVAVLIFNRSRSVLGQLIINQTDPTKDVYRIHIEDLQMLETKKNVLLKIINEDTSK